jgi:hypothetical protein
MNGSWPVYGRHEAVTVPPSCHRCGRFGGEVNTANLGLVRGYGGSCCHLGLFSGGTGITLEIETTLNDETENRRVPVTLLVGGVRSQTGDD